MNRIHRLVGLVAVLAIAVTSMPARADGIDNIVFFGDSLSDIGNIWYVTEGFPPPPYFQGTSGGAPDFTGGQWSSPEGPSWPTPFASRFNVTATPSLVSGNNYAWGGARTGVNEDFPDRGGVPWLDQQVGLYLSSGSPGPGTLVSIMIGGNDVAGIVRGILTDTSSEAPREAIMKGIDSIISNIEFLLYAEGVDHFVVSNVPDVGATPEFQALDAQFPGTAQFATELTIQWNAALETALDELSMALPDAVIGSFDLFALGKDPDVLSQFENTTDACYLGEDNICVDPASYFYWDSFHPSSTSHAIIAEALVGEYVTSVIDQRCPCDGSWSDDDDYERCMRRASRHLRDAGLITSKERKQLIEAADDAECEADDDDD